MNTNLPILALWVLAQLILSWSAQAGLVDSDNDALPSERKKTPISATDSHLRVRKGTGERPRELVTDTGGPIREIQIHYAAQSERELSSVFQDLFTQLGENVRIIVHCNNQESADRFVRVWGDLAMSEGREIHIVNVNRKITVWARDRRIAIQRGERHAPSFVPTPHSTYDVEKHNDLLLPSLLWPTGLVPSVSLVSFHLEGGNIVSNSKNLFVGRNLLEDNPNRFEGIDELSEELERAFGKKAIIIGGDPGKVPWCHTDMYLTPIDDKTVLLASPVLGMEKMNHRLKMRTGERVIQADSTPADSEIQAKFDETARQLMSQGFTVYRLPALVNTEDEWMVTYNNVLMEQTPEGKCVYLPQYQIPLDRIASTVYERLGFQVKPIDVSQIYFLGGAVRCLTNVTLRGTRIGDEEPHEGSITVHTVRDGGESSYVVQRREREVTRNRRVLPRAMDGEDFRDQ